MTIDLRKNPYINIRANVTGASKVYFVSGEKLLAGENIIRFDTAAPFILKGGLTSSYWNPPPGQYRVSATPVAGFAQYGNGGTLHLNIIHSQTTLDPTPSPFGTWTTVKNENEYFNVSGTQRVRFGEDILWTEKNVTGRVDCTVGFFSMDPFPNKAKVCQVFNAVPGSWRQIAKEGSTFKVGGVRRVRFGVGSTWFERVAAIQGECNLRPADQKAFFTYPPNVKMPSLIKY